MWQSISRHISESIERDFKLVDKQSISGGDINKAFVIRSYHDTFFVKINDKEFLSNFISEADNLKTLALSSMISVPDVICIGTSKSHAFLILSFHDCHPLENDDECFEAGAILAQLHTWGEQKEYGFDQDNYIGATVQPNPWHKRWSKFFSEQRIGWQLQLLSEKGIFFSDIDTIVELVEVQLAHHQPKPSLLHGDLWAGNVSGSATGPIFYDPSSYWGDAECDLAFTELFGRFSSAFYSGYKSQKPIDKGYDDRKSIYNLYHVLNHCNCFGGPYISQAQQLIDRLQAF